MRAARSKRQSLYRRLRAANPSPFAALLRDGDFAIISSSPERLVSVQGDRIATRPIAGTRPRGASPERDAALIESLLGNEKERAEHVMLIDLERNDLGRVCVAGSVRVDEFMAVESYAHVHHIVSNVSGIKSPEVSPVQVLRAVFPGGTITGCPKVRCMQIIAELEAVGRGAYTGALGYLNRDGSCDFNILIRTITTQGSTFSFRAGAGIVADSTPAHELAETRAKAEGLLRALRTDPHAMSIWINGRRGTVIDCRDRGLQYGDGLFETMLVRRRRVRLLELHLDRLTDGCKRLRLSIPAAAIEREIILRARQCQDGVLKLIVTRGRGARGYRPTGDERCTRVLSQNPVPAAPAGIRTVRLCRTRLGINPDLAGLKTLNRLESVMARAEWRDARIWEGLMRDVEGSVVCGTMSNVFLRRGSTLMTPALDRCGVAGVMRRWVLEQAKELRLRVWQGRLPVEAFRRCGGSVHDQRRGGHRAGRPHSERPATPAPAFDRDSPAAARSSGARMTGLRRALLIVVLLAAAGAAVGLLVLRGVQSLDEPLKVSAPLRFKVAPGSRFSPGGRGPRGAGCRPASA